MQAGTAEQAGTAGQGGVAGRAVLQDNRYRRKEAEVEAGRYRWAGRYRGRGRPVPREQAGTKEGDMPHGIAGACRPVQQVHAARVYEPAARCVQEHAARTDEAGSRTVWHAAQLAVCEPSAQPIRSPPYSLAGIPASPPPLPSSFSLPGIPDSLLPPGTTLAYRIDISVMHAGSAAPWRERRLLGSIEEIIREEGDLCAAMSLNP